MTTKEFAKILQDKLTSEYGVDLSVASHQQIYRALALICRQMMSENHQKFQSKAIGTGSKQVYYLCMEFLMGRSLKMSLFNLGLNDAAQKALAEADISLDSIYEEEPDAGLGNGGLGRLAAGFLDSIATLGLTGDGVGLNYHYGLFRQRFVDNQQKAVPDEWLGEQDILVDDDRSYTVEFGDFAVTSKLVNIDVPGYGQPNKNRLRLFDLASVDDGLVPGSSIDFDKTEIAKNLTLFLYPDDSDEQGRLLRIYHEYFMVSNAAQLLIDEAVERGSNLHDLADYAVVQINDTHPTMVIPELIRLLTTKHDIEFDEAVTIVRSMVAYTNHTILAEALEKWPLTSLQKVSPAIADIIVKLDEVAKSEHDDPRVAIIDE